MFFKKGILSVTVAPFILLTGVLAAAMYPSMAGYQERARDTYRVSALRNIQLALNSYYMDNMDYPKSEGYCLGDIAPKLKGYLLEIPHDPRKTSGILGCKSGFGYRYVVGIDGQSRYVLAARMEIQKNANSDITQGLFIKSPYLSTFENMKKTNTQKSQKDWLYVLFSGY